MNDHCVSPALTRLALAAALTCVIAAPAAAQAPGELAPAAYTAPVAQQPVPTKIERNYSLQLVGADLASFATVVIGASGGSGDLARVGSLGYVFAAPAVHLLNGNTRGAVRSLGLRVSLPLAGMFIGYMAGPNDVVADCGSCGSSSGSISGMLVGGGIGIVAASLFDYAVLGKKTESAPTRSWQPTVGASQTGFSVGALGRF